MPADTQTLPPPPGDADESRVASLRSTWAAIVPRGPVEYQTGWQVAQPDVMFLLGLAEEALALRRFRDAVDAASVAYHAGTGTVGSMTLPDVAFERAVAIALAEVQNEMDALDAAREG